MITIIYYIMDEKKHASIRNEARTKDNQPNLGCILAMLSGVDSHKFSDVM
jgi:hypothetical protein